MIEYQDKIKKLQSYAKMQTQDDARSFDWLVYELASQQKPYVLDDLMDFFDDECEHPEVMYSLVHAIETFPDEIYLRGIIKNTFKLDGRIEWFETLFYRVLNSPEYYELLKKHVKVLPSNNRLDEVLDIIYQESKNHRAQVEELRALMKSK